MASSTVTIDTGEWEYVGHDGVRHTVTDAQTFTLTVTDGGVAAVTYAIPTGQSVTTTDGYTLEIRAGADYANTHSTVGALTDAGEGSDFHNRRGILVMALQDGSGIAQRWTVAKINPSDADFGSAGTMTMTLEDQFGNVMVIPATGDGITVGQAS